MEILRKYHWASIPTLQKEKKTAIEVNERNLTLWFELIYWVEILNETNKTCNSYHIFLFLRQASAELPSILTFWSHHFKINLRFDDDDQLLTEENNLFLIRTQIYFMTKKLIHEFVKPIINSIFIFKMIRYSVIYSKTLYHKDVLIII